MYWNFSNIFPSLLQQYSRRPENTGSKTWTNQKGRSSQESAQFRNHVISCRLGERQYFIVLHQHTDRITTCRTFYMTTIPCMSVIMSNGIIHIAIIKTIFSIFMFQLVSLNNLCISYILYFCLIFFINIDSLFKIRSFTLLLIIATNLNL